MKRIYLDYAATTPLDPRVRSVMDPFFSVKFGNPGSLHRFGGEASGAVFEARRSIGAAIGASPHELIFTASATEANNLALRGVVAAHRRLTQIRMQRPRLIVSAVEHESILETARDLEQDGVEVVVIPVSRDGFINLSKLEVVLNDRTVLVSVMYANNEIGAIEPISAIADVIRNWKLVNRKENKLPITSYQLPLFHTDAAQALQYLDCDVTTLGIDLMTLSAHKIYGPKGIGMLYKRNWQLVNSNLKNVSNPNYQLPITNYLSPLVTGGGQEYGLRSGTENVPAIAGFAEAVRRASRMRAREGRRVGALRDRLSEGFRRVWKGIELNGPALADRRLPNNLNVHVPGIGGQELLVRLDLWGVAASAGSACGARAVLPSHVLRAIGCNAERAGSSIRFTLGRFTTRREIDAATRVLKNIREKLVISN